VWRGRRRRPVSTEVSPFDLRDGGQRGVEGTAEAPGYGRSVGAGYRQLPHSRGLGSLAGRRGGLLLVSCQGVSHALLVLAHRGCWCFCVSLPSLRWSRLAWGGAAAAALVPLNIASPYTISFLKGITVVELESVILASNVLLAFSRYSLHSSRTLAISSSRPNTN
jgi:hypothetical protein